jgi:flagellar hook assembly protein FlgD
MISLSLSQEEWVTLLVYDVTGRRVVTLADGRLPAGSHQVVWDGRGSEGRPVSAGVYLYRLEAGSYAETRRMAVVR